VPPLTWTVRENDARTTVALRGELALAGAVDVYTLLLKCLAEQPAVLLIDLSEITVSDGSALSVFTAVVDQAFLWPGTPVLLCAATAPVTTLLADGEYGPFSLYESLADGLLTVGPGPPILIGELAPEPGAPRHARSLATEACTRWGLAELSGPASLVASELVTNAVEHAGTPMTLRLTRRERCVHVAVRDGSPAEPRLRRPLVTEAGGRGLLLVSSVATHWGVLPCRDGKVVWATLAA
jgi:anti-anti-sigma regulatory factor